jgi:hypothetical protein
MLCESVLMAFCIRCRWLSAPSMLVPGSVSEGNVAGATREKATAIWRAFSKRSSGERARALSKNRSISRVMPGTISLGGGAVLVQIRTMTSAADFPMNGSRPVNPR